MSAKRHKDPRIGKHGAYQPLVCAVTGQHVNGNHNTAIKINGAFFCRVLSKAKKHADIEAIRAELLPLVSTASKSRKSSKSSEVNADDQ